MPLLPFDGGLNVQYVTSQHIPEPVWQRQSVLCVAIGEVGLDYTHPKDEWVLQKTQLVRILHTALAHGITL